MNSLHFREFGESRNSTSHRTPITNTLNWEHWLWLSGLCLGMLLVFAPKTYAQNTARISGFVHDPSGAVIPGATVALKDEATGTERKMATDNSGLYSFDYVLPKTYTLTVQMSGFRTSTRTGIVIHPDDRLDLDVKLELTEAVQKVEVQAAVENVITTDSGAKTDVIGEREIQNLSTLGRSAAELLTVLPGVVNSGFNPLNGSTFGSNGVESFNVNGLRTDQNDVRLDNAHMLDPGCNCGNIIEANMDMIQEFSVKTSNFEADQGRSAMIMDTVLKSGGSQIHGEAYWYLRNAVFNANDWSNNFAGIGRPASKFNYPGFNIGGPVRFPHSDFNKKNDKMFFWVGMEWQRQLPDPGTELATVPTARMRQGDFTELLSMKDASGNSLCTPTKDSSGNITGYNGRALNMPCQLKDPNTWGTPIVSNILPASDVTGLGQTFLNVFPLPNYVDPNGRYNFAGRPLVPTNRNEETIRIDYNLSQNTRMYVHLARNADHQYYPYGLWSGENSGWTSNIPEPSPTIGINYGKAATVNVVSVLNPTLTNEVQFNTQGLWLPNHYVDPSKLSKKALGFNFPGMTFTQTGVPGFETGKTYTGDFIPQITDQWNYYGGNPGAGRWGEGDVGNGIFADKTEFQWLDNLTKVHGAHTLKFGVDVDRTRNDQNGGPQPEGMLITDYWGLTSGNEFGDILSQHFEGFNQGLPNNDGLWRFWNIEWYAQDSWKATRRLTLNYGARWSWMQPWNEARGLAATFSTTAYDPSQPNNFLNGVVTAQSGKVSSGIFPSPHPTLQPRVGFAYDLFGTGKTVIRGGGGIFVQRDQGNVSFYMANGVPFSFSAGPSAPGGQGYFNFDQIAATNPFSALGNLSFQAEDPTDRAQPSVYEYSFTVSQDIGMKTVLEASYVGNVSRHLYVETNLNAIRPGAMFIPGTNLCCANGDTTTADFRYYKPWGNINWSTHSSDANYNSLQVMVRRNVSRGLTLLGSYTWSKTLGYATTFQSTVDPFDAHRNYGVLPWDRSQLLNLSYIYQLPNLGARYVHGSRFAKGVLDDWQISGITHFSGGAPIFPANPTINGCTEVNDANQPVPNSPLCKNGNMQFSGGGISWYGTPDIQLRPIYNPVPGGSKSVGGHWVSPYTTTLPAIGQYGTFETPIFRGPGSQDWDMTLFKSFPIGEKRRLEFRLAAFDVFNHANLDQPIVNDTYNWIVPSTASNYTGGHGVLANPADYGVVNNAHGHREVEMALKFYF